MWVDGVHFNVRLEDDRLCTLVMIGARPDGSKELVAVEDGYRESAESWASLLRDLKRRGMSAPLVAVGDGALGFWAAVRDVWPETRTARCWCHKLANVLDKLPKRLQPERNGLLHEVMYADTRDHASRPSDRFVEEFESKYPKAAECLRSDQDQLSVHFDFPAEHWKHLRTTNIIESPFSTVRLRQRVTKGAGSRDEGPPHGVQAARHGTAAVAQAQWRGAAAAGPCRRPLRRWSTSGEGEEGYRAEGKGRLIMRADPQHLTIAQPMPWYVSPCHHSALKCGSDTCLPSSLIVRRDEILSSHPSMA